MKKLILLVAEVVPLKQGLKQKQKKCQRQGLEVAEVVPLKQGLKHYGMDMKKQLR